MNAFTVILAFINIIVITGTIAAIFLIMRDSGKFDSIFPQTRQEKLLRCYPKAQQLEDVIDICPDKLYGHNTIPADECAKRNCYSCKERFWLEVSKDESDD